MRPKPTPMPAPAPSHGDVGTSGDGGILFPSFLAAKEAQRKSASLRNIRTMGIAFHNFHDVHKAFPASKNLGQDRKYPASWRVELLPYLDQAALYKQYRFDEPWDSENNRQLLEKMPAVYRNQSAEPGSTSTGYVALVGPQTAVGETRGNRYLDITDGTSNTLLIVESATEIPWTKPEDVPYAADKPIPALGGVHADGFVGLLADGSSRFFQSDTKEATLRALISRNGGEPIPR